jgi:hypothetical protein
MEKKKIEKKKEIPLKINGTLDDVLKVAVKGNPKPTIRKNKRAST